MKIKGLPLLVYVVILMTRVCDVPTYAASGDVAGTIEGTRDIAPQQIKIVMDNVMFPAIDLILAVFFLAEPGTAYFDYRKHGQFERAALVILFACLASTLTAPPYI